MSTPAALKSALQLLVGCMSTALPGVVTHVEAAELRIHAATVDANPGTEVDVPIEVAGSRGLEGLQFVLTFDSEMLEIIEVNTGPLAGVGQVDAKVRSPGRVRVAMYPEKRVNGDGTLLLARFRALGAPGATSMIELVDARAWEFDSGNLLEMFVVSEPGTVTVASVARGPVYLVWAFVGLAVVVVLVVWFRSVKRRQGG